jgi:hypothetical protein
MVGRDPNPIKRAGHKPQNSGPGSNVWRRFGTFPSHGKKTAERTERSAPTCPRTLTAVSAASSFPTWDTRCRKRTAARWLGASAPAAVAPSQIVDPKADSPSVGRAATAPASPASTEFVTLCNVAPKAPSQTNSASTKSRASASLLVSPRDGQRVFPTLENIPRIVTQSLRHLPDRANLRSLGRRSLPSTYAGRHPGESPATGQAHLGK